MYHIRFYESYTRDWFTDGVVSPLVKHNTSYTLFVPAIVVCKNGVKKGCFCALQGSPAESAMKILYHVILLFVLGGISCQNKSNSKPTGKSSKKAGSQTGDGAHEDDAPGGPADGGRGSSQQSASNSKSADEMKLHFLKNTQITCNDGTAAGWGAQSRSANCWELLFHSASLIMFASCVWHYLLLYMIYLSIFWNI